MNIDEALLTAGAIQFFFFAGPVVLISALVARRVYRANHPHHGGRPAATG